MASSSTDLVKAETLGLSVLDQDPGQVLDAIRESLGGEDLNAGDLDRVKVPAGGGTTWEIPYLGDTKAERELRGVLVFQRLTRRYYQNPEPQEGQAPDCWSPDNEFGYGQPGDQLRADGKGCNDCPKNAWGSDVKGGKGKACKQYRELYLLTAESGALPFLVAVPPASLKGAKQFMLSLAKQGLKYWAHGVELTLEKATGPSGAYSLVKMRSLGPLDPKTLEQVQAYADRAAALFERRPPAEAAAVNGDGE